MYTSAVNLIILAPLLANNSSWGSLNHIVFDIDLKKGRKIVCCS